MNDLVGLLSDPATYVSLATLAALEIVLGIDNIVFISILTAKLPAEQQNRARRIGLLLALVMRVLLLLAISWIMRLTTPLFTIVGQEISGKDLILIVGGLFLIGKASHEIFDKLEAEHEKELTRKASTFGMVIVQVVILDIVFSLDSVITAVGMAQKIPVMIAAVVISIVVMMVAAKPISDFVNAHPSIKVLALSFLVLIGVLLVADGFDRHIPKGYVYFAMAYALLVELINMRVRKARAVKLKHRFENDQTPATAP